MPIYEYKCKKGHVFDVMQRMTEDPLNVCKVCGATAKRVLHAPAVHFKGSGFYNTDYGTRRRAREAKENEAKSASESSGGSGESKSGESKSGESKSGESKSADSKPKAASKTD
jgi:putative FmdB family regulatory protein